MQIEEGKYYKTRYGKKIGPIGKTKTSPEEPRFLTSGEALYFSDGQAFKDSGIHGGVIFCPELDIVAEWVEEAPRNGVFLDGKGDITIRVAHIPVKTTSVTTTRREIIPGVYGRMFLGGVINDELQITFVDRPNGTLDRGFDKVQGITLEELDEAIHILNQCREVLAKPEETK